MSEYDDLVIGSKLRFKGEKKKSSSKKNDINQHEDKPTTSADERSQDAENHGGWWKVSKNEHIDEDVAIEFSPGCYAKALSNGSIGLGDPHEIGDGPDEEEIFTAISAPSNQFALKSGFGRYLSVDPKTKILSGLSEAIGEQELFLASFEGTKTAICCFTDTFLGPHGQSIIAKERTVTPNEMLTIRVNYDPLLAGTTKQSNAGELYESELGHLKKMQSKSQDLDRDKKQLKKAKLEGNLHETLLDKREKQKSDKYCK